MADIKSLADSAIRLRALMASHVGWPLIIVMTIERQGIRFKPDVKRLATKVRDELVERGEIARKKTAKLRKENLPKVSVADALSASQRERLAAQAFPGWLAKRKSEYLAQVGVEMPVNFTKLTRLVYAFIESSFSHLPQAERPAVDVTESLIRSAWAQKGARARSKKLRKEAMRRERIPAPEPEQLRLF